MRRLFGFVLPSLVGVALVLSLVALAESALNSVNLFTTLAGAGFSFALVVVPAVLGSVLLRALWRSWGFAALWAPGTDERGANPHACAWILYLCFALLGLALASFQSLRILFFATRINSIIAITAPVLVALWALVFVALSRPFVKLAERVIAGAEERRRARGRSALWRPSWVASAIVFVTLALAFTLFYAVLLPRVGHFDLGFVYYILAFVALAIAAPLLLQTQALAQRRPRLGLQSLCAALAVTLLGAAVLARFQKPSAMLQVWGEGKIAGFAIDRLFDVQDLREELDLEGVEPKATQDTHPNIVLITVDTVRAERISLYGGRAKMPALSALARKSAVFEHAFAPGNVTRRSLPSIATGLSPGRIRGRVAGWALRMDPRHVLLAERLSAGGYDTAGFFCCASFFGRRHRLGLIRGLDTVEIEYAGAALSKKLATWVSERAKSKPTKPLFVWTHFIEPHNWFKDYKQSTKLNTKNKRYEKSLEATDAFLGTVISAVEEKLGDNTIIVITADHGEGLDRHGIKYHSGSLYNTELQVPLVIRGPGVNAARIEEVVGLVDVAPTLLELAGFEPPGMPHMDGLSIAPLLRGEKTDRFGQGEAYGHMMSDRSVPQNQWAIVSGRYKLIAREGARYELYDYKADPREETDIKDEEPEILESMKARLRRRRAIDKVPAF